MHYKTVILGAGLTGLSAAFFLKKDYLLVEKESFCGGAFNSDIREGYCLDYGERFVRIFPEHEPLFKSIFGEGFFKSQALVSQVHILGKRFDYPFQYNLRGLDPDTFKRCLCEFVIAQLKVGTLSKKNVNFLEWIMRNFGRGMAELFFLPYNRKIWCMDPSKMSSDWFFSQRVVPEGSIKHIVEGLWNRPTKEPDQFSIRYYPRRGGAASIPKHMASRLKGDVLYGAEAKKIDLRAKKVFLSGSRTVQYKHLVSTIPLNELARMVEPLPQVIKKAASKLAYNSVLCVSVAVKGGIAEKCHWVYFPEKRYRFARLYFPNNFSRNTVPHGRSVIGAIITSRKPYRVQLMQKQLLSQLVNTGVLSRRQKVDFIHHRLIPYGFCLPLLDTRETVNRIRACLNQSGVHSIGRYGEWKYSGMEHALEDGKRIALQLLRSK